MLHDHFPNWQILSKVSGVLSSSLLCYVEQSCQALSEETAERTSGFTQYILSPEQQSRHLNTRQGIFKDVTDYSSFQKELTEKENANVVAPNRPRTQSSLDTADMTLQEPQAQMRISVLITKLHYFSEV